MKLHCAVTHFDEITLDLCLQQIERQSRSAGEVTVISGVSPASNAFNQALDAAHAADADFLIHLAADVMLDRNAVRTLMKRFDPTKHYAVVARGFDIFNGENSPVGLWGLNMRAIGSAVRFNDTFKMDLDFCERLEVASGLRRIKTKTGLQLGYHHPIWTARELFHKFRYNSAKYSGKEIRKYRVFFDVALAKNPENKALRAGLIGLNRGMSEPAFQGAPNRAAYESEWEDIVSLLGISGREFFAYHCDFVRLGERLIGAEPSLKPMAGPSFIAASISEEVSMGRGLRSGPASRLHAGLSMRAHAILRSVYHRLPPVGGDVIGAMLGRPMKSQTARKAVAYVSRPIRMHQKPAERSDWAAKWEETARERRVLMVAPKDFAGSMFKWAEALNRHSNHAVRLITFEEHQYGYPLDIVLDEHDDRHRLQLIGLADQAGVFHLKDEHGWFLKDVGSKNPEFLQQLFFSQDFLNTPKAFTHYGGYARKLKADADYISCVSKFDLRIAMTPDLNFEWFGGEYIPHTIDDRTYPLEWHDSNILAHSPSTREKKGTYLLEEAVMVLQRNHPELWSRWSLDLIHGIPFAECMARKRKASLFFDQAGRHRAASLGIEDFVGWYGNSAIEAMTFGIPTIAHLSAQAFEGAQRAGIDMRGSPVINILPTREDLLRAFLKFATMTPEKRAELSQATRQFAVEFHGYAAVAKRLAAAYGRLTTSA